MYHGFFRVFVGLLCFTLCITTKNDKTKDAKFLKKYIKQILFVLGLIMLTDGTLELIKNLT